MPNQKFAFKQFVIHQDKCAMKVGTDAVLLGAWIRPEQSFRILDIGTGTGVIALMLAQKSEGIIDAIDIDLNSCLQAKENVLASKWSSRINVLNTSFQDYCKLNSDKKYDLIVSNPPYFIDSYKATDEERSKARHADTLPYKELLDGVIKMLAPAGKFCVILPTKEAEIFKNLAEEQFLFLNKLMRVRTKEHTTEKRWMMRFEFTRKSFSENTIVIEHGDEPHSYTSEYKELTKDYYLAF